MNRREAIQQFSVLMGGAFALSALPSIPSDWEYDEKTDLIFFTKTQKKLVAELAETIIPKTKTPGAKEAGVAAYIEIMLRDCYNAENQKTFLDGLLNVDSVSSTMFRKTFLKLKQPDRNAVLKKIEQDTKDIKMRGRFANGTNFFYDMLKSMTVTGYFTSDMGANQALAFLPIPGPFQGCVPMTPNQKAWAL